jgi:hypothetical protein
MTFFFKVLSVVSPLHRSAAVASQNGLRSSTFFSSGVGT